jgi:hypothetical protein
MDRIVGLQIPAVNSSSRSYCLLPGGAKKKKPGFPGFSMCAGAVYLRNTEAFIGRPFDIAEW